jgi:hypothetical protein
MDGTAASDGVRRKPFRISAPGKVPGHGVRLKNLADCVGRAIQDLPDALQPVVVFGFHQAGAQAGDVGLVQAHVRPARQQPPGRIAERGQVQVFAGGSGKESRGAPGDFGGAAAGGRPDDDVQLGL